MYMGVLPACWFAHCLLEGGQKKSSDLSESGVTDGSELLCKCWELNLLAWSSERATCALIVLAISPALKFIYLFRFIIFE